MHFIYILTLTERYQDQANWDDKANDILNRHWLYLVDLHSRGVMKCVGRTDYQPGHKDLMGIAVFSAESEMQAKEIMDNDPCVKEGVMTAVLHPFSLALIEGKEPTH